VERGLLLTATGVGGIVRDIMAMGAGPAPRCSSLDMPEPVDEAVRTTS
jgi:phosphoribosylformylglycinamidine (FGAM) synthase-like enzyme